MNQLLYPLILQMESAANIRLPKEIVWGLASKYEPETVNKIMFQYKIWKYIENLDEYHYCQACGQHLVVSKSTTKTCSPRCHKIVKRHETSPIEEIKIESQKKLNTIKKMSQVTIQIPDDYPWHKLNDGWTYVLHN